MVNSPLISPVAARPDPTPKQRPQAQTCKQCRARKVKCDRRTTDGCTQCERLDIPCSYVESEDDINVTRDTPLHELTQAGTKRRRILKACLSCNLSRTKCSGHVPCDKCQASGIACQERPSRRYRSANPTRGAAQFQSPSELPRAELEDVTLPSHQCNSTAYLRLSQASIPVTHSSTFEEPWSAPRNHSASPLAQFCEPSHASLPTNSSAGPVSAALPTASYSRNGWTSNTGLVVTSQSGAAFDSPLHDLPANMPTLCATSIVSQESGHKNDIQTDIAFDLLEKPNKSTVRALLDAYFGHQDPMTCHFLHKASFISEWQKGRLDATFLKAVCAFGARLLASGIAEPKQNSVLHGQNSQATVVDIDTTERWMKEVEISVFGRLNEWTMTHLRTIAVLLHYRMTYGNSDMAWMLVAIAARIAFAKKLNYEVPSSDPVSQESCRRLMWSLFLIDKGICGGLEDLTACPTERMHLRLPGNERSFAFGIVPKTQRLVPEVGEEQGDMGLLAYVVRVSDVRHRVLR